MQITLDGYIAGPNDEMDWMHPAEQEWADLQADLDEADTYLLGRKMYPGYSKYWQSLLKDPSDDNDEVKFAKLANKTQHIVFTRGNFSPDWKNTRVAQDLRKEIETLKQKPGKNMIAWGGANFSSNLLKLGLVDELRFVLNPIILGHGKRIFDGAGRQEFQLLSSSEIENGTIVLRYRKR